MEKYEALYRILLSFMFIDNKIDEGEKEIILEYLGSRFGSNMTSEKKSIAYQKSKLGFENFNVDAKFVFNNCSREDQYDLLDFIGKMIKSDGDVDPKEVMLFENLLAMWKIDRGTMERYGIKRSLWSKFFS